jgi:hypothetical protein
LLTLLVLAGCGTDTGQQASSSSDAAALLKSTMANAAKVKAATVDIQAATGQGHARVTGPIVAGDGKSLPKFALSATVTQKGSSKSQTMGITWTGDRGFVMTDGKAYEVPAVLVQQLGSTVGTTFKGPLPQLELTKWISNPRNAGLATVDGVSTVKITGDVDVARMSRDLSQLTGALGVAGGGQLNLAPAVKNAKVEVYTGADDYILRRIVVKGDVKGDPSVFDLTLTKIGQPQPITAPANPRPFSELLAAGKALGLAIK